MSQTASQKKPSNLSKRRENCWTCAKNPAKLNNLLVYRISSNTRRGRVLTFEEISAAFIKGKRVKEGGVYFPIKLLTCSGAEV